MVTNVLYDIENLRIHTGIYTTVFVVRGHVNDTTQSSMHGTDNSDDFWEMFTTFQWLTFSANTNNGIIGSARVNPGPGVSEAIPASIPGKNPYPL